MPAPWTECELADRELAFNSFSTVAPDAFLQIFPRVLAGNLLGSRQFLRIAESSG